MHEYLLNQIISKSRRKKSYQLKKILLLGISYKSNCGDIRNSQLIPLVKNIKKEYG